MSSTQPFVYLASNEPPPFFMIFKDEKYIDCGNKVVEEQAKEKTWDCIHFVWVERKQEFMPALQKNMGKKLQDFKYVIRV